MVCHYKAENVLVMVNKYFYQEYFAEPSATDRNRVNIIQGMHDTSMKFISSYLTLGQHEGNVSKDDLNALVQDCFPYLRPYLQEQRATRGCNLNPSMDSIDYDALSHHLEMLTSIDWLALYRTSELEESRRGRAIR